jgi:glycosyl transferase family 25
MEKYFQLLNDYYDKIYVLSVQSATERREMFSKNFKGLNYEFFFGADKKDFSIEQVEGNGTYSEQMARLNHRFGKNMKHGEIACSLSHRQMYEEMLTNDYKRILIFEDDAVPDMERVSQIAAILREIPVDCDLLMWGWAKNGILTPGSKVKQFFYKIQHSLGRLKWNHRMIDNLYARPFSKNLKKAGFHDYTYAYALTKKGAETLLKMQTPVQFIADNLLAHATTKGILNGYIIMPQVFLHDSLADGTHRDSYIR